MVAAPSLASLLHLSASLSPCAQAPACAFRSKALFSVISFLKVLHAVPTAHRIKLKFMGMVFQTLHNQASLSFITHPPYFLIVILQGWVMKLFFISKLLLILLIRNSLSFLCSPTDLLWVCLCHAVLRLLTHLSVHLPAQMADSIWAELGLYNLSIPESSRVRPRQQAQWAPEGAQWTLTHLSPWTATT